MCHGSTRQFYHCTSDLHTTKDTCDTKDNHSSSNALLFPPHIVAYHLQEAGCCLGLITPGKGLSKLHAPFATYGSPARIAARLQGGTLSLAAVAGGPKVANQVVLLEGVRQEDLQHAAEVGWKVVRSSAELQVCCLQRVVARICVLRAPIKQVCLYSCPRRCKG